MDIVCISSIDWDFIWQGHQQIMSMLAAQGHRVLFVENTGVRPPRLNDLGRLRHRIYRWWTSTRGFRQEAPNLHVFSPLILPWPYSRVARWINRALLLRAIRRWMRVMRFRRPIVWTFLPTPLARDVLWALEPEVSIYYCIDDLPASSVQARKVRRTEERVFSEMDLVFVTSEKLRERAARFADQVHVFPFAVDYPIFEAASADGAPPADVAALPRPVVGYVGGIHQWVDLPLLAEVARRLPQVTFALVGPLQTDIGDLARQTNVRLLGACSHADVPRYLKAFDVALIPYRLTEYTASVYPTKLNEYLAMGLPVVSTDLAEVRRFNAEHGDIVTVGATHDAFVAGVRHALERSRPEEVTRRIEVARSNSWEARVATMSRLIAARLEHPPPRIEGAWEERLAQMYRVARGRLARVTAVTAVVLALWGVCFVTPLPWVVAEPLRVTGEPTHADAIVVLGGGVGESGHGGQGYQERVKKAVDLYRAGYAEHIVFSTGWTYTFSEGDLMRALAVSLGVPGGAIILEKKAASTLENARFVRDIAAPRGWTRILLVSAPYHMRRALLTFRKQAPDLAVVPAPATSAFYAHRRGASLDQLRALAHEYLGILAYWWRGWI